MAITKRKIGTGMTLVVALLVISVLMPTIASAYSVTWRNWTPWRGSGLAVVYVYGKGETQADDFTASWIKVTTNLQKYENQWLIKAQMINQKYNATIVSATARHYNPGRGLFRTHTIHEWVWPGNVYDWAQVYSSERTL